MRRVVVGLITNADDGIEKYLLVSSKRDFGKFTGCYYPPGGHIEDTEDEQTALVREVMEELNLEILPIQKIDESTNDISGEITSWWKCKILGGKLLINNDELQDAGYFSQKDITNLPLWPATRRMFEKFVFRK